MDGNPAYDIYVVAHVNELKRERDELRRRYERPEGMPVMRIRVEFAGAVEPWVYPLALNGRVVDAIYIDGARMVPAPVLDFDDLEMD